MRKNRVVGGTCLNTGTLPSKTLKDAIYYLHGFKLRSFPNISYSLKKNLTIRDLMARKDLVIKHELDVVTNQLERNNVEVIHGTASFVDPATVQIVTSMGDVDTLHAPYIVIATGSRPRRPQAFKVAQSTFPKVWPYGIYTVPEISTVGQSEEELTAQAIPYEVGRAFYKEIARGQIVGDLEGLMKLIFHRDTLQLLGVHIIGDGATELVHIGQAVLSYGGTVDFLVQNVFNYPTLAECYRTAALDGINRLGRV